MQFEFGPNKSASNLAKHGLDFIDAQALWSDPERLEVKLRFEAEPRYAVIGTIREKHWTAIIAYREERVRIISVRRSHKDEERLYDENL